MCNKIYSCQQHYHECVIETFILNEKLKILCATGDSAVGIKKISLFSDLLAPFRLVLPD
jgi:hypothetical protein